MAEETNAVQQHVFSVLNMPIISDDELEDDGGGVGQSYSVKRVIGKYVSCEGDKFYLIRWRDCGNSESTWEPNENVSCPELIEAYEKYLNGKRVEKQRRIEKMKLGFERGLQPGMIISLTNNTPGGNVFYLMQWAGSKQYDTVSAVEAHEYCPNVVLEFLERQFCIKRSYPAEVFPIPIPDVVDLEYRPNIEILGMILDKDEKLAFAMAWDGLASPEFVRYDQARAKIPTVLISYFLNNLIWREYRAKPKITK